MRIPLATVEEWDLVSIELTDSFALEFHVRGEPFLNEGRWWLEAWGTIASIAAVTSPDGMVTLLQRRKPGDAERARNPRGWAFVRAGDPTMHFIVDTQSLCDNVRGYGGLCYTTWEPSYFDSSTKRCPDCIDALSASSNQQLSSAGA